MDEGKTPYRPVPDWAEIEKDGEENRTVAPLFVGYAQFEDWLGTLDTGLPAYVLAVVEAGAEQAGLRIDALLVICQQRDLRGDVHYCRLRAADLSRCFGEPFCRDWRERERAWHSLAELAAQAVKARGIPCVSATVAMPRNLRSLQGSWEAAVFDPATKRFRLRGS